MGRKKQKYHTVRTVPISNRKLIEKGINDTPSMTAQCPSLVHALALKVAGLS
jgi:hypothetical protein